MGRLTQYLDYLHRDPKQMNGHFTAFYYTHMELNWPIRKTKMDLGLYRKDSGKKDSSQK
jgi:hypothetical protein